MRATSSRGLEEKGGDAHMAKLGKVEGIREEIGYQRRDWVLEERLDIRGETGYQRRD